MGLGESGGREHGYKEIIHGFTHLSGPICMFDIEVPYSLQLQLVHVSTSIFHSIKHFYINYFIFTE